MSFALRGYQERAVTAVQSNWQNFRRQLLVAATGAGKTIMFASLCERTAGNCMVLVHREELLQQAADKIRKATGIIPAIERGDERASLAQRVVVATIQTVGRRLSKWPREHFELVIMRGRGIVGRGRGRRRPGTTDRDHADPVAPNRLGQREAPVERPNEVWAADVT